MKERIKKFVEEYKVELLVAAVNFGIGVAGACAANAIIQKNRVTVSRVIQDQEEPLGVRIILTNGGWSHWSMPPQD